MEYVRIGKVTKAGTSLAIVIPAHIARALNVRRGDSVIVSVFNDNQIVARILTDDELRALKPKAIT